ncbi:DNA-(apurinic or apyrimidinic site) lyase [Elysia marginata]|uniref:exodeoxyribonuclease III n=1 Tax=Elysia marginata TaxID=1093978 RepID=A0AAV4EGU1_9GAST|nr:DNA-(apurinic or apyrimidinic site) lyase [Elysia marginata]
MLKNEDSKGSKLVTEQEWRLKRTVSDQDIVKYKALTRHIGATLRVGRRCGELTSAWCLKQKVFQSALGCTGHKLILYPEYTTSTSVITLKLYRAVASVSSIRQPEEQRSFIYCREQLLALSKSFFSTTTMGPKKAAKATKSAKKSKKEEKADTAKKTEKPVKSTSDKKAAEEKNETAKTKQSTQKRKAESPSKDEPKPKLKARVSISETIGDTDFSSTSKSSAGKPPNFKIASWNINGIRAWLDKEGLSYLKAEKPDVLCVQELKCDKSKIPAEAEVEGYTAHWLSGDTEGYSGVGMYYKTKPIKITEGIGIAKHDDEGRCITAEFDKFYLVNTYIPNSGRKLVRLKYRTEQWDVAFRDYLKSLDAKKPVIWCGDLNVNMNSRKDVVNLINEIARSSSLLCNANVIKIILDITQTKGRSSKQKFPYTAIAHSLIATLNFDTKNISLTLLRRKLQTVYLDNYSKLIKNIARNSSDIDSFLRQEFVVPFITEHEESADELNLDNCQQSPVLKSPSPVPTIVKPVCAAVTPVKTRTDCDKCPAAKKLTFSIKKSLDSEKKKVTHFKHLSASVKKDYKVRETRQKAENEELQKRENSDSTDTLMLMKGKMYSSLVRQCIYQQLLCDVPITNCGTLLKNFVAMLLEQNVERVPCAATCSQMAYELGVLSTLQLTEFMLSQKDLCLSWDATSLDLEGEHVNEIHVTANKVECLILDIKHLPGGKSSDYASHIMSALTEAASSYANYKGCRQEEVFHKIRTSISATLTDRAVVNACVTRQLRDELESELIQLNCNVHPLDSVAREVRKMLCQLDRQHDITGHCYGSDGTAANLINAVSVLRNRLHVMFHLAGTLVRHYAILLVFTEDQCTGGGLLRASVMKDLRNERIMMQVWALGICGKVFSGPWMTQFYSSRMSNLEMGPLIQQCVESLQLWLKNPNLLLQPTVDAFGKYLDPEEDPVLAALMEFSHNDNFQVECLREILKGTLAVLNRQLQQFLTGEFVNPAPEILAKTAGAPSHNMCSERNLGCYDRLWRRAPNATVGFLTGKVKCKMNKTLEWLRSKDKADQEKLIGFAVNEAREERVRTFTDKKTLEIEISERKQQVALQRQISKKNTIARQVNKALKSKDASALPCPEAVRDRLQRYIQDPMTAVGLLVLHSTDNAEWYARILNSLPGKFEMGYWTMIETESNIKNPKTNKRNAGFTQEERDSFTETLEAGFIDSFRELHPEEENAYTFWTYMMNCRAKNVGWRLDYFVVSKRFQENICESLIRSKVMGSDHCPIALELAL